MATKPKKSDKVPQEGVRDRILELRALDIPERVYLGGRSEFDGIPLQVFGTSANDVGGLVDELIGPCKPTSANAGYNGVFEKVNGGDTYALSTTTPLVNMIKLYVGDGAEKCVVLTEVASPANISCHILQDPSTTSTHVFFMPSTRYVARIEDEMRGLEV